MANGSQQSTRGGWQTWCKRKPQAVTLAVAPDVCGHARPSRLKTTPQPGCKVIDDESLRAPQSWRGSYRFLVKCEEFLGWDPTNSSRGAGDSEPVFHPYTTAEPHSPVGKSLRATFDGLLSSRLLVALVDEI